MTCVSTLWPILDHSPPTHRCLLFAVNTSSSFVNDPIPKLGPPVLVDCPPRLCIRPTATAPATLVDPNRGLLHCHPPRENWSGLSSIRDSSGGVQRRTCARSHRMQHCRQFSTTAKLGVMAGTMTKKRCEAIYPCINSLINYLQIKLWKGWWTGSSKKKKTVLHTFLSTLTPHPSSSSTQSITSKQVAVATLFHMCLTMVASGG